MYLSTDQLSVNPHAYNPCLRSVESIHEKGSGALNEDVLLETEEILGVFDGATSLDKRLFQGNMSGGLLAARTAADTFRNSRQSLPLPHITNIANTLIREALQENHVSLYNRHHLWSTSLAVVRINEDQLEYCQTGDAHILLIYNDNSHLLLTPDRDIDSETLQIWKQMAATPSVTIHDALSEQIKKVRLKMNRSYGVLNGEPAAMNFLCHGHHDLTGVRDVLLFTDGLFLPKEDPCEPNDWSELVNLYLDGGLQAVQHHVRSLQESDPVCHKYPRFKKHDDIAAIAIKLQNVLQPATALT